VRTEASYSGPESHGGVFATTHWRVVLAAGVRHTPESAAALERLCGSYWYPLYAYVRRRGYGPEDSQDLTQAFFARFLARNYMAGVDRRRGRFRSYLLGALNHFLADEWDHSHRLKRGGQAGTVPFDATTGEARYALEPADERSPDRLFERRWALALLDVVWRQLQGEYQARGKERLFDRLSGFLTGDAEGESYPRVAEELEMTEGATRVAVHRLRQRYGELFRQAVADTVEKPEEIPNEMRHLLGVLSS
jgi:DNA-directed RNA polymerase specialized sigma24 family protein